MQLLFADQVRLLTYHPFSAYSHSAQTVYTVTDWEVSHCLHAPGVPRDRLWSSCVNTDLPDVFRPHGDSNSHSSAQSVFITFVLFMISEADALSIRPFDRYEFGTPKYKHIFLIYRRCVNMN